MIPVMSSIVEIKDVYLLITRENERTLKDMQDFIWYKDYCDYEKKVFKGDIGKILGEKHIFRFRFHNNVIIE